MTSANAQATTVENPNIGDEAQSLSAGADYSALFSAGESDSWTQDTTQSEWLPGFRAMDPLTRRDALNRHLQTPKFTYESIVRTFLQQQQQQQQQQQHQQQFQPQQQQTQQLQHAQSQYEAQKKGAERDAMEREMRMRAEQQRQFARSDRHGLQPKRF